MSTYSGHPVFQCDHSMAHAMKQHKDKAYEAVKDKMHHKARVQTLDGEVYEGTIIHVDFKFMYLSVESGHHGGGAAPAGTGYRAFFPGFYPPRPPFYPGFNPYYSNVILPLALFDLLTVTLLL